MDRSVSQIYRMILVLCDRGYVQARDHGFTVTSKAFCLALDRPEVDALLTIAEPEMQRLARATRRTCYLSAAHDKVVIVVAVQPWLGKSGLDVRVGMRQPLINTASGQVHFGFQSDAGKEKWRQALAETEDQATLAQFVKDADRAAALGQAERTHRHMDCLTEISSPVTLRKDQVFALSLLYLHRPGSDDFTLCRTELSQAAWQITQALRVQQAWPDRSGHQSQSVEMDGRNLIAG
ncbi:DNA-binding IclR family transcriptional regulator [Asticcacaulis solisilvae]|nr:DNA-binding IclR family transcriptional regulator [Asticcacaulis solisilvae]MDR6799881.1 DNA-binding IclR family transcriptional regulator [Asticcacaulis sp. BE141]